MFNNVTLIHICKFDGFAVMIVWGDYVHDVG